MIAHLFNMFIIASFAGWIYECIYCTVKSARWQNRGFLFGPVCPIYGAGYLLAYVFYVDFISVEHDFPVTGLMIFLLCAAGSAFLEYTTSYTLEKIFHARWWDYSNIPFNLNGRICLPATLAFGLAGLVFEKRVLPFLMDTVYQSITLPAWGEEFLSLCFMLILGADLALSISSVTGLLAALEKLETQFDSRLESVYKPVGKTQRVLARKVLRTKNAVSNRLDNMAEYRADFIEAAKAMTPGQVKKLMSIVRFTSEKHTGIAKRINFLLRKPEPFSKQGNTVQTDAVQADTAHTDTIQTDTIQAGDKRDEGQKENGYRE